MKRFSKGFTLIELLVVVAIIAILTALIITNISSARGKARDAKRVSDLNQIQLALEQYFDKNRSYPADLSTLTSGTVYISVLPKDPSTKLDYFYSLQVGNLDYVLEAKLEYTNSATADGLTGSYANIPYTCNPTGLYYCIGPK